MDVEQLYKQADRAAERAITHLYDRQREDGSWVDRLSSSTIATALGALSLHRADPDGYADRVAAAVRWLREHQRTDRGWSTDDLIAHTVALRALGRWLAEMRPGDAR